MLAYYGSRISEHMTQTPEGFLICHDVPINRTGRQQYLRREIGLEGDGLVTVYRDEDEVFSKAALASFEGKPVTQDHPPCAVEPHNFGMYSKPSSFVPAAGKRLSLRSLKSAAVSSP